MRIRFLFLLTGLFLAGITALVAADKPKDDSKTDSAPGPIYQILPDPNHKEKVRLADRNPEDPDQPGLYVSVDFLLEVLKPDQAYRPSHMVQIREDKKEVKRIPLVRQGDLTAILALDTSKSMGNGDKMIQAKRAIDAFLEVLPENANCGLVIHNSEGVPKDTTINPLNRDATWEKEKKCRDEIISAKNKAQPIGGTVYYDAIWQSIDMFDNLGAKTRGKRAVFVITDGFDNASKKKLNEVRDRAKKKNIQVYTIGVGAPGAGGPGHGNEVPAGGQKSVVMVLDHSGSMARKAVETDDKPKIEGLHDTACDFIDKARPGVGMTIQPFSSEVEPILPFTEDKEELKRQIRSLKASGGTMLYDAIYAAIGTLAASAPEGERKVVVMTDGVDEAPGSRHRWQEVVEFANSEHVSLEMVGLGQDQEINSKVMQEMANATKGTYVRASNVKELAAFFDREGHEINQQAINEDELTNLATDTGGKYVPAKDVSKLSEDLTYLIKNVDKEYHPSFKSGRQVHDGTLRGIEWAVIDTSEKNGIGDSAKPVILSGYIDNGQMVTGYTKSDVATHGVIVPDHRLALVLDTAWGTWCPAGGAGELTSHGSIGHRAVKSDDRATPDTAPDHFSSSPYSIVPERCGVFTPKAFYLIAQG